MVLKFNKTKEPFGGVVEWFKALVLKTNESGLNKNFKILQKHSYHKILNKTILIIKSPYQDSVTIL